MGGQQLNSALGTYNEKEERGRFEAIQLAMGEHLGVVFNGVDASERFVGDYSSADTGRTVELKPELTWVLLKAVESRAGENNGIEIRVGESPVIDGSMVPDRSITNIVTGVTVFTPTPKELVNRGMRRGIHLTMSFENEARLQQSTGGASNIGELSNNLHRAAEQGVLPKSVNMRIFQIGPKNGRPR